MSEFFGFLRMGLLCGTLFSLASVVALSLPKSKFRTVLSEFLGYGMVVLCGLYVISPVDCIPEAIFGPFGYIDDVGAMCGGYMAFQSAMKARKERQVEFSNN
jgi:uncharacterized membrane protein YkvA (DUF1232 family)